MSGYLRELERLHSVANGDDGIYDDTGNGDYVIIKSNGLLVGMPRAALEGFKKMNPVGKVSKDKKPDPYYVKHRKSRW